MKNQTAQTFASSVDILGEVFRSMHFYEIQDIRKRLMSDLKERLGEYYDEATVRHYSGYDHDLDTHRVIVTCDCPVEK